MSARTVRRVLLWTLLAVVLATAAIIALLPELLSTDRARREVEDVLSEALGRRVSIERIEVARDAPSVDVYGFVVAESAAFEGAGSGGPMLRAEHVRLDVSLEALRQRQVVGGMRIEGVELRVRRKDNTTNLHGLRPIEEATGAGGGGRSRVELDLDVEVVDATVHLEDIERDESLELQQVSMRGLLSNREGHTHSRLRVGVPRLAVRGLVLEDLDLYGEVDASMWTIDRIFARVGEGGRVEGSGRIAVTKGERHDWSAELKAHDIAVEGPVLDAVLASAPELEAVVGQGAERLRGVLGGTLALQGAGVHWLTVRPTLQGRLDIEINDLVLPPGDLARAVATIAQLPEGPVVVPYGRVECEIAEGWVTLGRVSTRAGPIGTPVRGRVGLDGTLDLAVDLMPLLRLFGDEIYDRVASVTTSLPIRIQGSLDAPKIVRPEARDVAVGLAGALLRRALSGDAEDG